MKTIKFIPVLLLFLLVSCSSVSVNSDYDPKAPFASFKTYAFSKNGIDKVEISDLDKKRILYAIEEQMTAKGFTKSETPDVIVNFFTKEREQVSVGSFGWGMGMGYGYGWGWGYSPMMWGNNYVNRYIEGTLFIDIVDAKKKELVWQGVGEGTLTQNTERKDARIKEFVTKIFIQYPPGEKK